ncbi:MAG: DNA/RNA nuclease SfsA [Thermoplasmatota archaeon]
MEFRKLIGLDHSNIGHFADRPNRFLALVDIASENGEVLKGERVHVHDPGRLKEILIRGAELAVKKVDGPHRKTGWDLIAGKVDDMWVLVHSGYHRAISEALLGDPDINPFGTVEDLKAEVSFGRSRMDFLMNMDDGSRVVVEVKGCSLTIDGAAIFPDVPTTRGTRHLRELISLLDEGYRSGVLFLVFRKDSECFHPNEDTDPAFAEAFREAVDAGVEIYAVLLSYDGRSILYHGEIPVCGR